MFGFFRNKRAEKPIDELSNSELLEFADEFTERGDRAMILLNTRRDELQRLYSLIYQEVQNKLFSSALDHISQYVRISDKYGELVREPVFILFIVATEDGGGSPEDVFSVYDSIISYYKTRDANEYVELFEKKRADYEITVNELKDLERKYGFIFTTDIGIAINHLEGLAVYRFLDISTMQNSFDNVWLSVLKEVELFESEDSGKNLNKTTYKGAKNWLRKFAYLCSGAIPDEYKE